MKKEKLKTQPDVGTENAPVVDKTIPNEVKLEEPKSDVQLLLEKVAELERKDKENETKLKMLVEVADKGRVFNYEATQSKENKQPFKVKLSLYGGGIMVGWRTVKDELVKHPTTGRTVGENQEFELLILQGNGDTQKVTLSNYVAFSNARYDNRIECVVVSKSDDFSGNTTFDVQLPDGRVIKIASSFVN